MDLGDTFSVVNDKCVVLENIIEWTLKKHLTHRFETVFHIKLKADTCAFIINL